MNIKGEYQNNILSSSVQSCHIISRLNVTLWTNRLENYNDSIYRFL